MKTTAKNLARGLMLMALVMTSCQKEEPENDVFIENAQEEGFVSKTEKSDSKIETSSEVLSPLLHVQYDGSMSREETQASFDTEVAKFMKSEGKANRSQSYIYFQLFTYTGTGSFNETDGNVQVDVKFLTNKGTYLTPEFQLNDPILNDREKGAWDHYFFGYHFPSSINWVEFKDAVIALQGTDGWFMEYFGLYLPNDRRYSSSSGGSYIFTIPNTWLDNSTARGWDYHSTGPLNGGRLNFD